MSKKNLLITAILLVAIATFVQVYNKRDSRQDDSPVGKPLAAVNLVETIDSIKIAKGEKALHLKNSADGWGISEKGSFPVNMEKLVKLLDHITSYRIASVVTKDEQRLPDFNLTPAEGGTQLILSSGEKTLFSMIVGKNRPPAASDSSKPSRPDGTYIRIGESAEVFLIKENLEIETDQVHWMKKVLFTLDKSKLKSLRIESPSSRLVFERKEESEKLTLSDLRKGETAQQQPLSNLMEELESFEISDALPLDESFEKDLRLQAEAAVALFDNASLSFQILAKTKKNAPAKKKGEEEELVYYVRLIDMHSADDKRGWKQTAELGRKWLFEVDSWRAKHWLKKRQEYIKSEKTP